MIVELTTRGTWSGELVEITGHALLRWQHRCCNGDENAVERLAQKIADGGFRVKKHRPSWAYKTRDLKHKILTEGYLIVDQPRERGGPRKEVAFPLTRRGDRLFATTALVQGWDDGRVAA